ncbi:DUF6923 family protein [Dyadobacter sp. LHD-138]|uniref:DUF6923 family protein n=1 Tax=Dyadobacter sp. LHD-138 TaxID=3071413 RepID=UPI0027E116EB|nr:T9SS type A sorting domain-containing protein [Dyadobacter sp. LHD-138]MDQ6480544.1 T9SS type A sorting domain-containing protein [Dyadobacter sp. LHD-138]
MKRHFTCLIFSCLVIVLFPGSKLFAQSPFSCQDGVAYQIIGNPSVLYTVDFRTGVKTELFNAAALGSRNLTGLGYNSVNNYLYAAVSGTNDIVKIESNGTTTLIDIPGLPTSAYTAGAVSPTGIMYLYVASTTSIQRIDLNSMTLLTSITLTTGANLQDISISPDGNYIYGISAGNGQLVRYPIGGGAISATEVGFGGAGVAASVFMDNTGDLFLITNASSSVYEISGPAYSISTSTTLVSPALNTAITNTDGASCITSVLTSSTPIGCKQGVAHLVSQNTPYDLDGCDANNGTSTITEYNLLTGAFTTSGQLVNSFGGNTAINAVGYNPTDGYIWGYRLGTNQLVRIGANNTVDFFAIQSLPNTCPTVSSIDNTAFTSADVSANGVSYLLNGIEGTHLYLVDINPSSPNYLQLLGAIPLSHSPGVGNISAITDIAFNPIDGLLYAVTVNNNLIRINPTTGSVNTLGVVSGVPAGVGYVTQYFDVNGNFYIQAGNGSNDMYRITNVAGGGLSATLFNGNGFTIAIGGDGANCATSLSFVTLSGSVLDDGNGATDGTVNTSGLSPLNPIDGTNLDGVQLYVSLVNSSGAVIQTVAVSSSGTYTFNNVEPGTYSTVLSTISTGTSAADSPLPTGWDNTGEQIGTALGGEQLTANGVVTNIVVGSVNVDNLNFGINKKPVVASGTNAPQSNPGGSGAGATVPVTSGLFAGSDLEDGSYPANLAGETVTLTPGANGDLYYDGIMVPVGGIAIPNFDPSKVSVDPSGTSNQEVKTVEFTYTITDNAGVVSDPKAIHVPVIANPLPVTLVRFTAKKGERNAVMLDWATTAEINSEQFEVQHSTNGKNWDMIKTIAASGESKTVKNYMYTHDTPVNGLNYYRLKMIDQDATYAFSRIVSISFEGEHNLNVYPNPVSDLLQIINVNKQLIKSVEIIDIAGKIVYLSSSERGLSDIVSKGVDISKLPSGAYVVRVSGINGILSTSKIIVVH